MSCNHGFKNWIGLSGSIGNQALIWFDKNPKQV